MRLTKAMSNIHGLWFFYSKVPLVHFNVLYPEGRTDAYTIIEITLPGCTYDDCREIQGDCLSADVAWGDGTAFRKVVEAKQWVRIQVELEHAEIFSIDTECAAAINPMAPIQRDL